MGVYSTSNELNQIRKILSRYIRLPFSRETIPGAIMEGVLAHVKDGQVLNTYDFVDVIKPSDKCGWQVKSTKSSTPVTWKRAKIPNSFELIEKSRSGAKGLQDLGDAIIEFCDEHARQSLKDYQLEQIGYARLVINPGGQVTYFERLLCTTQNPNVFEPKDFEWMWSKPKHTNKKEQLQALRGIHKKSGKKWWAWHGLGENQLHFSGENAWWPSPDSDHTISFRFPSEDEKLSLEDFLKLLSRAEMPN